MSRGYQGDIPFKYMKGIEEVNIIGWYLTGTAIIFVCLILAGLIMAARDKD